MAEEIPSQHQRLIAAFVARGFEAEFRQAWNGLQVAADVVPLGPGTIRVIGRAALLYPRSAGGWTVEFGCNAGELAMTDAEVVDRVSSTLGDASAYDLQVRRGAARIGKTITLVPMTREEVLADVEALSPADRAQVSPDWLARTRATPSADPWSFGFRVVRRGDVVSGDSGDTPVGRCGFKGTPADGVVEIAYAIDEPHRGRGYATEAARALVRFAFADGGVRVVLAHTLPGANASSRVLAKCGFRHVGPVVDPEDGPVWRWEAARRAAGA